MTDTDYEILKSPAAKVTFRSSTPVLDEGFEWAKKQAMAYAHFGENAVGLWYEAALPGRNSFCIRDVCHQSIGANILGLGRHTKNMLSQFIMNIHSSRDYCTYWEITDEGRPTPVDYTSDEDFWYNLPANFDLIRACYLQYLWTGDRTYLWDDSFNNFYSKTACEYLNAWDKDGDGIPEHYPHYGRRGIASYNESDLNVRIGGDMIAIEYAGLLSYAEILRLRNEPRKADKYAEKARRLADRYQAEWWNDAGKRFYGAMKQDRTFYGEDYSESNFLSLLYGIATSKEKLGAALKNTLNNGAKNVEGMTYIPELYYRYGLRDDGYKALLRLIDPGLHRREYPEVSFCAVSSFITGLMGINAEKGSQVSTTAYENKDVAWTEIRHMPIFQNEISIKHIGSTCTEFTNCAGDSLMWKAAFPEETSFLYHNGKKAPSLREMGADGIIKSCIAVKVCPGEKHTISSHWSWQT